MAYDTGGRLFEMTFPFHHTAAPVTVPTNLPSMPNLSVPIPNLPFSPLIPEPMAALMKPVCAVVPNPSPNDRFTVNMPEDLYNAMVCEPELAPCEEDMVTTCCRCGHKNYTWDLKWNKAKIKLKCMEEFMIVLKKQIQFNIIPSPSATNQPTSLPSGIVCPPPDVYNLKSNLSATAQEFRPIQNQKPNVHVDETQNANKDEYTICRVSSINNDESSRLPNEPLDTNDSGILESGIDSGVHDSGVSDSGVTDPTITDTVAERFVPNEDPDMANACNACESDSLKNEKDVKKKAKKKRTKSRLEKSNNGSLDNLVNDAIEDAEFTNQNSDIYYNKSTLDVGRPQQNDIRVTNNTYYRGDKQPRRHTNDADWQKVPAQKTAWTDSRNGQVDRDHSSFMDVKPTRVPSKTAGAKRNDTNSCEPLGPGKPRDARGPSANRRPSTNSNSYGGYSNKKFGKPYNNVVHETDGNLFSAGTEYALAHCVAEDFRMSAGIAVQFKKDFGCVGELLDQGKTVGEVAVLEHSSRCIFYLITKPCSNNKPTPESMKQAIKSLKEECVKRNIKKLAMPRIGCGLDKLNWKYVKDVLNEEFGATDAQIVVYNFKEEEENAEGASHSKKPSHQKGPLIYRRPGPLADIERSTAVVVYGTIDGHMDKTCETVNVKYPFKDYYLKNCKKGLIGDVLPVGVFGPPYQEYVFVFLARETASESYSFKHLETCVKNLNVHLKKWQYIYVGFEYLDDQNDPMFNEKVLNLFRNNIYVRDIEIYACNCKKNEEYASHASQNSNNDSSTYNSNYSRRS